tara:strand:- start:870 stop:986 length:117 start_codon:yes stop_codon:yes gene_type:complete
LISIKGKGEEVMVYKIKKISVAAFLLGEAWDFEIVNLS